MDSALKRMLDFETPLRTAESTSLSAAMVEATILEDGKDNTTALCVDIAGGQREEESELEIYPSICVSKKAMTSSGDILRCSVLSRSRRVTVPSFSKVSKSTVIP